MRIALGSDHAGFALKENLKAYLEENGHEVIDCGCFGTASVNYPVFAKEVSKLVAAGGCERGLLICFTGIGMSIAANRVKGIRAALCRSCDEAFMTRQHNDANILVLGAKYTSEIDARVILQTFLETPFSEGERHKLRISLIEE